MDFLSQLLRGIAFVPALVSGIEGLLVTNREPRKKMRRCLFCRTLCPRWTQSQRGRSSIPRSSKMEFR